MTQVIPPPPPTWSRVKAILADALDLDPDQRDAFLDRVCDGQPALRRRLADLVGAYAASPAIRDADSPARTIAAPFEPQPGATVGRYRIVRPIGRGGMGSVYEAVDEQLGRPVAIKVMQAGIASRSMLKRFDLESRLLARLRHPGIAQIFEAGTVAIPGSDEPTPFFAMELISAATPITRFADAAGMNTEGRIRLFLKVCEAVTHGHQRSVIHRDLKPANILVDGSGQPKIIDFGVARATDPGAAATTLAGELLGTLRYMSPEQVAGCDGDPDDLDVRTDVYSLGIVLYELLCGQPPHPDPQGGVLALIRAAPQRVPAPLSRFDPRLCGDLETVALKAVQPDRRARYQSVSDLAADLERVLRHEPISARPLSAVYQARMFARRHRALVAGFAAVFAALLLGIIGTTIGLIRARDAGIAARAQTRRAERIAAFLANTVRSADPQLLPAAAIKTSDAGLDPEDSWLAPPTAWGSAGPADVGVAGVLRHAAEHLDAEFGDDPALQAEVATLLASTLASLEDSPTAARLLESALRIRCSLLPADDETIIRTRTLYASVLHGLERGPEAVAQFRAALNSAQRQFGPLDPRTLVLTDLLTRNLAPIGGGWEEAIELARRMIRIVGDVKGPDSSDAWLRHVSLINLLQLRGTPDVRAETIAECRATIDGLIRTLGPESPALAHLYWCLASELGADSATVAEAEALQRRAIAIDVRSRGPDSNAAYDGRGALVTILLRQHRFAEAEDLARQALESALRMIGPRSKYTAKAQGRLARVLTWEERDIDEAERLARQATEVTTASFGAGDDFVCYHQAVWAATIRLKGHPEQAEAMLRERLKLRGDRPVQPNAPWVEAYQYLQLALCLRDQGRAPEASEAIRTARAWADQLRDPMHPILLNILDVQPRLESPGPAPATLTIRGVDAERPSRTPRKRAVLPRPHSARPPS